MNREMRKAMIILPLMAVILLLMAQTVVLLLIKLVLGLVVVIVLVIAKDLQIIAQQMETRRIPMALKPKINVGRGNARTEPL